MQNTKEERWRPTPTATPSSRLRAARAMPPWLVQARGSALPPPPPPPTQPPPNDPDYEVIEFTNQQAYSNTPPPRPTLPAGKGGRCDLCGSSAPAVKCDQCSQQSFCLSCDEMYHRHPKRQTHLRKPLDGSRQPTLRPPLPPKGENTSAPVPPPRRNKRSGRSTPVLPDQVQGKSVSPGFGVVGSLKRMMGGRPLPPAPPLGTRDPRMISPLTFPELSDHQPPSRDSGYLDWEMDSRHRSGSLTALNSPAFTPLMHAQSMAQLNCPSCHHHGMVWDWNHQGPLGPVPGNLAPTWGGLPTGTWHGSAFLPPYRPHEEMGRRNSLRAPIPPRRSRRDLTTDDEDDLHQRRASPSRSRRGGISDESEDEVMSHRGGRRHRRRNSPVSRNVSPALSRKSSRKKSSVGVEELIARRVRQNEEDALRSSRRFDDDTMSNRGRRYDDETLSNRGSRRYDDETTSNRGGRRFDDDRLSIKSGRRFEIDETSSNQGRRSNNDFDDSMSIRSQRFDDDVISNRGGRRYDLDETMSNRGRKDTTRRKQRSPPNRSRMSPAAARKYSRHTSSEDSGDEMSDGGRHNSSSVKSKKETIDNVALKNTERGEDVNIPSDVDKPLGPVPNQEWECDHCTFVNPAGTRVCSVCCKTTTNPKYKQQNKQPKEQNKQHKQQNKQQPKEEDKFQENKIASTRYHNSSTSPLKEDTTSSFKNNEDKNLHKDFQVQTLTKSSEQTGTSAGNLAEKMKKQLSLSSPTSPEKKKGRKRRSISFWLGTKLYS